MGFGSFQKPLFGRSGPMLFAGIGITLSAVIGSLASHSTIVLVLIAGLWAFLFGLSGSINAVAAWVGLQCCIYLIISSVTPTIGVGSRGMVEQALMKGSGMLAGSVVQYTFIRLVWHLSPGASRVYSDPQFEPTHLEIGYLRQQAGLRSLYGRFALRLFLTAIVAVSLYRYLHFSNAYWIAMTAIILPHQDLGFAKTRTVHRFLGTLLGAGIATMIAVLLHPSGDVLGCLVLLFAWCSYALASVSYAAFVLAITAYIAFLLAIMRSPEGTTLEHRILATFIGGTISFCMHLIFVAAGRIGGDSTSIYPTESLGVSGGLQSSRRSECH